jgi:enamidase
MASLLLKNIGTLVTGDLKNPLRSADSIFIEDGIIREIGNGFGRKADRVIDAAGITAMPGLIDSHSHPSIGEYTPAQNSLSWITHYMHGGVTALVSAGELHLPGLPLPPDAPDFELPVTVTLSPAPALGHGLRFEVRAGHGHAALAEGRYEDAHRTLTEALKLWRGDALADRSTRRGGRTPTRSTC